jgi:hypothetical protein
MEGCTVLPDVGEYLIGEVVAIGAGGDLSQALFALHGMPRLAADGGMRRGRAAGRLRRLVLAPWRLRADGRVVVGFLPFWAVR